MPLEGIVAAIMVAFRLVIDAGDDVVYSEPAWFGTYAAARPVFGSTLKGGIFGSRARRCLLPMEQMD
jgi:aspartate/methionine/tyrosine aminotransferase